MQYLNVNERQNSLSSIYSSSMESLSSLHGAESYWSIDQELAPISTAIDIKDYNIYGTTYTISRLRAKKSVYHTGFSAAELDEERKHKKNGRLRVRKAFSFNRHSSKVKKASSADKETPLQGPEAAELLARLSLLEDQIKSVGEELCKERAHREELEQKVDSLQSENEQLKSEREVAGDQLQKFYKQFFDLVNSIPSHLLHNGLSTTSLNKSTLSMRTSISSIRTSASSITSQ